MTLLVNLNLFMLEHLRFKNAYYKMLEKILLFNFKKQII